MNKLKTLEAKAKTYFRERLEPREVQKLKALYNGSLSSSLALRGALKPEPLSSGVTNLFHGSVQKTGSTWIQAVISDPRLRAYHGLLTYPQHRYEWGEFISTFPKYTYIPGLYIPYGLYEEIRKPPRYKTLYVVRDPRDILVSWYYSTRDSHALMGKVLKDRPVLQKLDFDQGIMYSIEQLQLKFSFIRSWVYGARLDENVHLVRFEDLVSNPSEHFSVILANLGIRVPDSVLFEVLGDYTFEKMRDKDKHERLREEGVSHYRVDKRHWSEELNKSHIEYLSNNVGDLIELLEY